MALTKLSEGHIIDALKHVWGKSYIDNGGHMCVFIDPHIVYNYSYLEGTVQNLNILLNFF